MTATYDAVLFDLDGVLTSTASLRAACWKAVFDDVLDDWARSTGEAQEPFDVERDYLPTSTARHARTPCAISWTRVAFATTT
jgi:beta-phosphoglucomutase-like phosphatase (HAD superfamily)